MRAGALYAGMTIGLLGGSFNPAHDGHLALSRFALKRLGLDQVWWLVSPQNPLKPATGMAQLDDRLVAARRLAQHPRIRVSALEAQLGTCYTIDTLRALRRRFPRTHFVWLMGADNLRQIPKWRAWEEIFQSLPIAVFRRPLYAAGYGQGKAALRFGRAWRPAAQAKNLARIAPPAWVMLDNRLDPHSATALRQAQISGKDQRGKKDND